MILVTLHIVRPHLENIAKSWDYHLDNYEVEGIFIDDMGGGHNATITKRSCHSFEYSNHQQELRGYQDNRKGKS